MTSLVTQSIRSGLSRFLKHGLLALALASASSPLPAQGAADLAELVQGLGVSARVLVIAAHPDDEDTRLIAWLARGRPEETFQHWPRDSVLGDVVTVVRAFRPHVIVAIFSGTPDDGHGHHQVSGILAREAYDASGDTVRFPPSST